jgi:hypothetical protein
MKLQNGMTVIAPDGCNEYLTAGESYEVFNVFTGKNNTIFNIIDDEGETI